MIATPIETQDRPAAETAAVKRPPMLAAVIARLAQLVEQGQLTEREFRVVQSSLFGKAPSEGTPTQIGRQRVYLNWSESPMMIKAGGPETLYEPAYARVNQALQPYFGYDWEYSGASAREAVKFDKEWKWGTQGGKDGFVTIKGAWVDLERELI
jgi:hypothetical protein